MSERGVIKDKRRAQQINDFSGLRLGNITPTDIDGLIEYHDKAWIVFEIKYKGAQLLFGQRLAIERMTNAFTAAGKKAMALVVEHNVDDTDNSVDCAKCFVREVYYGDSPTWRPPKRKINLREAIDEYFEYAVDKA